MYFFSLGGKSNQEYKAFDDDDDDHQNDSRFKSRWNLGIKCVRHGDSSVQNKINPDRVTKQHTDPQYSEIPKAQIGLLTSNFPMPLWKREKK